MTASLGSVTILSESQRLIQALEQRQQTLPIAASLLSLHHTAHRALEDCQLISDQAVNQWRNALARRWECEVEARRLYKQVVRQLAEHYGELAPQMQLITRGGAEINSSPAELVEDLQRLNAALTVAILHIAFAGERLAQISQAQAALEAAIEAAQSTEQQRRNAVLESRMAREVFRRTTEMTLGKLAAHYGERFHNEFHDLLATEAA
jgi:uncharacterized protein YoxC